MFKYILLFIGAVVLYKLIFDFIIPVYRASRDIKKRFRDINQQMHERMNESQSAPRQTPSFKKPGNVSPKGDYIDFEDVK